MSAAKKGQFHPDRGIHLITKDNGTLEKGSAVKILAIETSGTEGSIALAEDERLICELQIRGQQRMAQALLPTIQQALRENDWHVSALELICVVSGPGSFTGLRIGITAAKLLAYCCDAEITDVNTLQAIAARQLAEPAKHDRAKAGPIVAAIDAQRKQLFRAEYKVESGDLVETASTSIVERVSFGEQLPERALVTGTGLAKIGEQLLLMRPDLEFADEGLWRPSAREAARIGLAQFKSGQTADKWKLVPRYFRKSAAEEKLTS